MSFTHRLIRYAATSALIFTTHLAMAEVTVDTKFGEVTVQDDAKRVVTLHEGALDVMSAIGVKVVGTVSTRGSETVSDYLADKQEGIHIVGSTRETNLEAVIKERPDVILAGHSLTKEQYSILSNIAPTVVSKWRFDEPDAWRKEALLYGTAVSQRDDVNTALQAVDARAADIKSRLVNTLPEAQRDVFIARWMPQGPMVMAKTLFAGSIVSQTGLSPKDGQLIQEGRPHSSILSLENLGVIDGDWLFLATLNNEGNDALNSAKQSSAFSRLQVVQQDHVATVDGQVWSSTSGPLAAQVILDDIERILDAHN